MEMSIYLNAVISHYVFNMLQMFLNSVTYNYIIERNKKF